MEQIQSTEWINVNRIIFSYVCCYSKCRWVSEISSWWVLMDTLRFSCYHSLRWRVASSERFMGYFCSEFLEFYATLNTFISLGGKVQIRNERKNWNATETYKFRFCFSSSKRASFFWIGHNSFLFEFRLPNRRQRSTTIWLTDCNITGALCRARARAHRT